MVIKVDKSVVLSVALANTGNRYTIRQFRTLFGVSPALTAIAWNLMLSDPRTIDQGVELKDLLKAQHFLKCYSTETHLCKLFKVTEKTFRERYKFYAVANLVQLAIQHEMPLFEVDYS